MSGDAASQLLCLAVALGESFQLRLLTPAISLPREAAGVSFDSCSHSINVFNSLTERTRAVCCVYGRIRNTGSVFQTHMKAGNKVCVCVCVCCVYGRIRNTGSVFQTHMKAGHKVCVCACACACACARACARVCVLRVWTDQKHWEFVSDTHESWTQGVCVCVCVCCVYGRIRNTGSVFQTHMKAGHKVCVCVRVRVLCVWTDQKHWECVSDTHESWTQGVCVCARVCAVCMDGSETLGVCFRHT